MAIKSTIRGGVSGDSPYPGVGRGGFGGRIGGGSPKTGFFPGDDGGEKPYGPQMPKSNAPHGSLPGQPRLPVGKDAGSYVGPYGPQENGRFSNARIRKGDGTEAVVPFAHDGPETMNRAYGEDETYLRPVTDGKRYEAVSKRSLAENQRKPNY